MKLAVPGNAIIVDTDGYSGNFHRELGAFATGQIAGCGVGSEIAKEAFSQITHIGWWNAHTVRVENDRGNRVPNLIWPRPGWFNNGWGNHFPDVPSSEVPALLARARATEAYYRPLIARTQGTLRALEDGKDVGGGWTVDACHREIARFLSLIDAAGDSYSKAPAYMSVAFFVREFPGDEVLAEFIDRCRKFLKQPRHCSKLTIMQEEPIEYAGYRLVAVE